MRTQLDFGIHDHENIDESYEFLTNAFPSPATSPILLSQWFIRIKVHGGQAFTWDWDLPHAEMDYCFHTFQQLAFSIEMNFWVNFCWSIVN